MEKLTHNTGLTVLLYRELSQVKKMTLKMAKRYKPTIHKRRCADFIIPEELLKSH